ncbi:MAG: 6-pyruvoyltetrahydropterin/6-carboxytetrahydropterin synthase [Chloroflexi bacterium]|nr:MAG: 6-pyruvoyltetrahydropterin/6-carboxytetrahydropterin synthase [Chloroflexota bacterium]
MEVDIEAEALDDMGMVVDFGRVRDLVKGWIDSNLDHRMILCRQDPVVPVLQGLNEPLYLVDENPTAENLARLIYDQARHLGLDVAEIRLWETPSSYATYREA